MIGEHCHTESMGSCHPTGDCHASRWHLLQYYRTHREQLDHELKRIDQSSKLWIVALVCFAIASLGSWVAAKPSTEWNWGFLGALVFSFYFVNSSQIRLCRLETIRDLLDDEQSQ